MSSFYVETESVSKGGREVASVAVMSGSNLLMGRRKDSGKWTLPGGGLEPGEKPEEGAKRELFEEAGVRVGRLRYLGSRRVKGVPDNDLIMVHAFLVHQHGKATVRNDPDKEVSRWSWIDVSNGLPKAVEDELHSPRNVVLMMMGIQKEPKPSLVIRSDLGPIDLSKMYGGGVGEASDSEFGTYSGGGGKKPGGPGSRGGKVIGRTRSGKPIYESASHSGHNSFFAEEHLQAAEAHKHHAGNLLEHMKGNLHGNTSNFKTLMGKIEAHMTEADEHRKKAETAPKAPRKKGEPAKKEYRYAASVFDDSDILKALKEVQDEIITPKNEMVKEHEHLVAVLESPSHEDDKVEAKKQAAELEEYKKKSFVVKAGLGGSPRPGHKYLRRYRRNDRWVYVYREPEGDTRELNEEAMQLLHHLAVHGDEDATYLLNNLKEKAADEVLDRELNGTERHDVVQMLRNSLDQNVFRHLNQHTTSPFHQTLTRNRVTLDSVMSQVRGQTLRGLLTSYHNALRDVDRAHSTLQITSSQNTNARGAGGYANLAYNRALQALETRTAFLPARYSEVHRRGTQNGSNELEPFVNTQEMREAAERQERERQAAEAERERQAAEERERIMGEYRTKMTGAIIDQLAPGIRVSPDQIATIHRALKNMFGGNVPTREQWPYDFSQHGYKVKISHVDANDNTISFTLNATNAAGEQVTRSWRRSWRNNGGHPAIYNALLETNPSVRGTGPEIGELINKAQNKLMQETDPDHGQIEVFAAMTVGGYNWANQGFRFDQASGDRGVVLMQFKNFLAEHGIRLTDEELSHFKEPCHFAAFHDGKFYEVHTSDALALKPDQVAHGTLDGKPGGKPLTPSEVSAGRTNRMLVHLGKKFLLGKSWHGISRASEQNDRNEAWRFFQIYRRMKVDSWKVLNDRYKAAVEAVQQGQRTMTPEQRATAISSYNPYTRRGSYRRRRSSTVRRPNRFRDWTPTQQRAWLDRNRDQLSSAQYDSAWEVMRGARHRVDMANRALQAFVNDGVVTAPPMPLNEMDETTLRHYIHGEYDYSTRTQTSQGVMNELRAHYGEGDNATFNRHFREIRFYQDELINARRARIAAEARPAGQQRATG